jgi:hypothetical protein
MSAWPGASVVRLELTPSAVRAEDHCRLVVIEVCAPSERSPLAPGAADQAWGRDFFGGAGPRRTPLAMSWEPEPSAQEIEATLIAETLSGRRQSGS